MCCGKLKSQEHVTLNVSSNGYWSILPDKGTDFRNMQYIPLKQCSSYPSSAGEMFSITYIGNVLELNNWTLIEYFHKKNPWIWFSFLDLWNWDLRSGILEISLWYYYDTRLDLKNNINSDPKSFRELGFRSMSNLTRLNPQSFIRVLFLTQMEVWSQKRNPFFGEKRLSRSGRALRWLDWNAELIES